MKRAFIVGIGSFLGSALRKRLEAAGWLVEGSTSQQFDFKNPKPFQPSHEYDVIIYCAYVISFVDSDPNLSALTMLRHSIFEKSKLHVFVSSVSAIAADSTYARSKREAEAIFAKDTIVRPGLILGDGGLFETMSRQIQHALVFPMFDGGGYKVLTIEIGELSEKIYRLIEEGSPQIVNLVQTPLITMKQMYFKIRGGKRFPIFIYVPSKPVEWMLQLAKMLGSKGAAYALDRIQGLKANDLLAEKFEGH